jgi:hypothetical protein
VTSAGRDVDPAALREVHAWAASLTPGDLVLVLHRELLQLRGFVVAGLPASGRGVCRRVVEVVLAATDPHLPRADAAAAVRRVAAENRAEGVPAGLSPAVVHTLLRAVRAVRPGAWDSSVAAAWTEYLGWVQARLDDPAAVAPTAPVIPPPAPLRGGRHRAEGEPTRGAVAVARDR